MEKPAVHHPSDDSDHSGSNEKIAVEQGAFETLGHSELPLDPDAHLSDAERAAIVSLTTPVGMPSILLLIVARA